jgi:hypothetical protein
LADVRGEEALEADMQCTKKDWHDGFPPPLEAGDAGNNCIECEIAPRLSKIPSSRTGQGHQAESPLSSERASGLAVQTRT